MALPILARAAILFALLAVSSFAADSRSTTPLCESVMPTRYQRMQARRDAEKARRHFARWKLPTKVYTDEERAKSRWQCSEMLLITPFILNGSA